MGFCKTKVPSAASTTQATYEGLLKYSPELFQLINENVLPEGQAKLNADKILAPQQRELDTSILKGPGADLISAVTDASKQIDPEFFNSRAMIGKGLSDLFGSIDLSGKLNGSESAEIERNLNRMNAGEIPSNIGAVKSGIEFGRAGQAKKEGQQQIATGAIASGTSFLPASRTGIDPLQIATGRKGVDTSGLQNTIGGVQNTIGGINQQTQALRAGQPSFLDKFNEFMGAQPDY